MANRFIKIGGAFFRDTPEGLAIANDPANIRRLQSGDLPFETRESTESTFSRDVSQPSLAPTTASGGGLLPSRTSGTQTPTTPGTQNPFENFNLLLLDAFKKAKGVNTLELQKRKRALELARIDRSAELLPEELRTLSTTQKASIRSGRAAALSPDVEEAKFRLAKAEQEIAGFESIFFQAQKLGAEFAQNMVAPESTIQAYKLAIEANPDNLATLLSNLNDKTRNEVIKSLDPSKLKEPEVPTPAPKTLSTTDGIFQWDGAKWIATGLTSITEKVSLRDLPATQTVLLADGKFLPTILDGLQKVIEDNKDLINPLSARVLFSEKRKIIEDDLRRAAQLVGKFMEGGVLRKEDEIKYREMLPKLDDLNSTVALDKLKGVRDMLAAKTQGYIDSFDAAGFDVSGFRDISVDIGGQDSTKTVKRAGGEFIENPDGTFTRVK